MFFKSVAMKNSKNILSSGFNPKFGLNSWLKKTKLGFINKGIGEKSNEVSIIFYLNENPI